MTADQIIALKNSGLSDAVLTAMINTASKPPVQTSTVVERGPYVYPSVYIDPWPMFWWGWGPGCHYGGYYHGGYHHH